MMYDINRAKALTPTLSRSTGRGRTAKSKLVARAQRNRADSRPRLRRCGRSLVAVTLESPRLSAELLLAHVLAVPRIKLYTDYERPLAEKELATYRALVQRAGEHEP